MNILYLWSKLFKKIRGKAIINSSIDKTSKVGAGSQVINSKIGRFSFCGYDCSIINCEIGDFCSLASNISIGGASHPLEWVSTSPAFYVGRDSISKKYARHKYEDVKKTIIGNDVWIGEYSLIKAGVTIGDGAVVGMGSVVTKDIGSYEIWAGNPAKFIRKRFDDEKIEKLLRINWWNFSEEEFEKYGKYFNCPDVLISEVEK